MTLENEIEMYDRAKTDGDTGETELWDKVIFPNIIRKRELEIISDAIFSSKPKRILDLGCGGGWLSKIISSNGNQIVGIDVSESLIKVAKNVAPKSNGFIVGDCMNLGLKSNTFDLIIGMGILHHLDLDKTLSECHRVLRENGLLLIMEPNALNPLMAIGRRLVPEGTCTEDERSIVPNTLMKGMVRNGLKIQSIEYLFPYSFSASYISGKIQSQTYQNFIRIMLPIIEGSEKVVEKIPFIRKMNSTIIAIGEK